MATYIISYDLNKQKDYPKLYDAIKSAGTDWCHPMDSTWLVVSSAGAAALRDYIAKAMDQDDSLLVCKIEKGDSAWRAVSTVASAWLKANL